MTRPVDERSSRAVAQDVPDEVEAKLVAARAADLQAIAKLDALGLYRLRPQRTMRLHTRYLDTPDFALARHGVALRTRRDGRRWELTVKWGGSVDGAVHRRPELTVPLREPPATPFRLEDPTVHTEIAALIAGRPLQVVLISDIRRRAIDVRRADAEADAPVLAEIALDQVHLHDGATLAERQQRYFEIEVEQRAGSVEDLGALVGLLRERFALEPSEETKFSKGLALLHGFRRPTTVDTDPAPTDDVATATRKIVARQLARVRRYDPGTRRGEDPEALHDMRVAVRRLRAARKTLRPGFPPALHAFLGAELRWLGGVLGAVRDLDVQLARVAALARTMPPSLRAGLETFEQHLHAQRAAQRRALLPALDSRRYATLLLRLERFALGRTRFRVTGEAALPAAGLAADTLAGAYRKLRKQGGKVHAEPRPEELHALRIRAKRVRYVLEFFSGLAGKPARRAARRLARLQDLLGAYNDSVVTAEFIQVYLEGPGARSPAAALLSLGAVVAGEVARGEDLRRQFSRHWKQFRSERVERDMAAAIERLGALAVAAVEAKQEGER